MKFTKLMLNWLIISYVLTIMVLSVAPFKSNKLASLSSTSVLSIRSDYLLHALLFVPWMILIRWRWREKRDVGFIVLVIVVGLLLAAMSEGVQFWLPYRAFNVLDLGANWVGVVMGALVSWNIVR